MEKVFTKGDKFQMGNETGIAVEASDTGANFHMVKGDFICHCLGGSHMYGLAGPNSDLDYRGVYISNSPDYILGLTAADKNKSFVDSRLNGDDKFYFELRRFIGSLKKTNTQAVEILYNTNWLFFDPRLKIIQDNKLSLLNSKQFFISLTGGDEKANRDQGYIGDERRLMSGERTGELGGKRKEALEKYGYSYKNAVQLLRLCYCGIQFFTEGDYPVYVAENAFDVGGNDLRLLLLDIKFNPQKYTLNTINRYVDWIFKKLCNAYDNREVNYVFNDEVATQILVNLYLPYLK